MFIGELIWSFPFYLSSFFPKSAGRCSRKGTIPRSLAQCGTVCNNNRLLEMSLWFPPCFQNVHFSLEMKTINHLNGQRGLKWGTMVECQLNCYCWLPLLETLWIVFLGGGGGNCPAVVFPTSFLIKRMKTYWCLWLGPVGTLKKKKNAVGSACNFYTENPDEPKAHHKVFARECRNLPLNHELWKYFIRIHCRQHQGDWNIVFSCLLKKRKRKPCL